jgi:hypothetical protein
MLLPLSYMGFVLAPLGLVYAHRRGKGTLKEDLEVLEDARIAGENLVLMAERLKGTAFQEPLPSYHYRLPKLPGGRRGLTAPPRPKPGWGPLIPPAHHAW